ncbi:MAG: ABC transporter ATP-binding protein [Acidimicrobiia bacterium]
MKVRISHLAFSYQGTHPPVLMDLDMEVDGGTVHAVVGPNGCGKSTLLRLIARLESPDAGSIDFVGPRRHDNLTALVFQDPRLLPWWSVERNIAIGSEFSSRSRLLYEKIRGFYTREMGLEAVRRRRPGTLSLGQQTMAAMGRGMAHDSEILLLDEPFAHLDAIRRRRLHQEFETHWQLDPRTVILVTHDVEEAVALSDRVSVMRRGPGPLVDTIEVDAPRPRLDLSPTHPRLRSAVGRVWDALERSL